MNPESDYNEVGMIHNLRTFVHVSPSGALNNACEWFRYCDQAPKSDFDLHMETNENGEFEVIVKWNRTEAI